MSYRYTRQKNGKITKHKARCSVRGDLMSPIIHYDPTKTATYAVDNNLICLFFAITPANKLILKHFDITSAFTAAQINHDEPIYVKQLQRFDGSLTHPNQPIWCLRLNLYATKSAGHIYNDGLEQHLRCNSFTPSPADPNLYYKMYHNQDIVIAVTNSDFLVADPFQKAIDHVCDILQRKYTIKDMRFPS